MATKNIPNREIDDLNRNIQSAQVRINEIYAAIGRAFYAANSENPAPEYAQMFKDMKDTESQIDQWQTRIKFINGIVVCTNCKSDNSVNAAFCAVCGTRLPHTYTSDGANRCNNCGNIINPGQVFCGSCGAKVVSAVPQPAPMPVVEPVAPMPVVAPVVEPVQEVVAPVVETVAPVVEPVAPVVEQVAPMEYTAPVEVQPEVIPEPVPVMPAEKFCPNCGAVIKEADALFCAECGTRLA